MTKSESHSGIFEVDEAGQTADFLTIFEGTDRNGSKHLFVPVDDGDFDADHRSTGVILLPQLLTIESQERWYADLVCDEDNLFAVFAHLADDVKDRVASHPDPLVAIQEALSEWRELLRRVSGGPKESVVVGLRGELEILAMLVAEVGASAIDYWDGPFGGTRDFNGDNVSLEVKTTLAQSGSYIFVHGIDQVTPPAGMRYAISLVRLTPNNQRMSINQLIAALVKEGIARSDLEERCAEVGWDKEHSEWDKGFECLEVQSWHVDDSFPGLRKDRIDPAAIAGIEDLNYRLDLAAGGPALAEAEQAALFNEVCS